MRERARRVGEKGSGRKGVFSVVGEEKGNGSKENR